MSRERERFDEIGKKLKREGNQNQNHVNDNQDHNEMGIRRHMLNTITPCAACKLLRRRCAQECPFSPYFSPHEPQKFACVHKVFGASNVSKMLMEVAECDRADAANSLVYEANVRLRDPVYGCMGAISALQQQVQNLQGELNLLRGEILKYKLLREDENNININHVNMNHHLLLPMLPSNSSVDVVSISAPPPPPPPPLPSNSSASSIYFHQRDPNNNYTTISSDNNNSNDNNNISYFG